MVSQRRLCSRCLEYVENRTLLRTERLWAILRFHLFRGCRVFNRNRRKNDSKGGGGGEGHETSLIKLDLFQNTTFPLNRYVSLSIRADIRIILLLVWFTYILGKKQFLKLEGKKLLPEPVSIRSNTYIRATHHVLSKLSHVMFFYRDASISKRQRKICSVASDSS